MIDFRDIFVEPFQRTKPVEALKTAIGQNEDAIMDLNRQQLDRGKDAKGADLGTYKRFNYKKRFRPIDLKLTGDFRDKFSLQISDKETEIFSQDEKYEFLKNFRGKDPLGIASQFIPNMQDLILPEFQNNYENQLLK